MAKIARFHPVLPLLAVLLTFVCIAPIRPAAAQGNDVSELINLINGLRTSKGLAPYIVNQGLMALAQQHSEYQASIHTSTHLHSDGRNPRQIGVGENVAGGDLGYVTPRVVVFEIWADPIHGWTMTGYAAGSMGVGVANDGKTVYYTLEVRPAGTPSPGASGTGTAPAPLTKIPLATLVPATPGFNGSIVHIVGYSQTLWAIALAYGIQIEQIRAWNNIAAGSTDIYVGQRLLVRPANLVMASPTPPTQPGKPQTGEALVSTRIPTATGTLTPSPGSPPTVPGIAGLRPTGAETQAEIQASSKDPRAESGLLTPILAGSVILFGCALLLTLRRNKQPS